MRTLEWDPGKLQLRMIDQRLLPGRFEIVAYSTHLEVVQAIQDMVVRGAPAIGVAAAYGLVLTALNSTARDRDAFLLDLQAAARTLRSARPTAVNLPWALDRMLGVVNQSNQDIEGLKDLLLHEAQKMADEDVETNRQIALHGVEILADGDTVIHHCNTGALATVDWGTALGVIRMAHEMGKHIRVLVDETRPRLQGSRLTAWELDQYGIPYEIISDNSAGFFLQTGQVQKVLFGADRVAANGDVANKIGTYMLALTAYDNNVPVYAVFPRSTVDFSLSSGTEIPIEERNPSEVLNIQIDGEAASPQGAKARNPAFDITPYRLLTGLITEFGIISPPFVYNLARALGNTPQPE